MSPNKDKKRIRTLTGIIVSDKMKKTVVVRVESFKKDKKYLKSYRFAQRYKAHDEKEEFHAGDKVIIAETRPISRDKRWKVIKKI